MKEIILASKSKRRIGLLKMLGLKFKVAEPRVEEGEAGSCVELALSKALSKLLSVKDMFSKGVIIAADTVVCLNGEVLEKPRGVEDARNLLLKLSGKWHRVVTGIALIDLESGKQLLDYVETLVKFKELSLKEIEAYLSTGEYVDKAGAYGIQGVASIFIEEIKGCYYNVVGLPLNKLYLMLREVGIDLTDLISKI